MYKRQFFLFGIPMFFGLYFGAEAIGNLMNSLPVWITNALSATGKMLPALGFERCVMYLTGMGNIRDVLPFPRTVNNCDL